MTLTKGGLAVDVILPVLSTREENGLGFCVNGRRKMGHVVRYENMPCWVHAGIGASSICCHISQSEAPVSWLLGWAYTTTDISISGNWASSIYPSKKHDPKENRFPIKQVSVKNGDENCTYSERHMCALEHGIFFTYTYQKSNI